MRKNFVSVMMLILSATVIVLAAVQILGIWDRAIHVFEPLIGVILLLQSVQNWKRNRATAVLCLCAALFIFCVAIIIWFC